MKVQKSAQHYTDAAHDEIDLLVDAFKHASTPAWQESIREFNDRFRNYNSLSKSTSSRSTTAQGGDSCAVSSNGSNNQGGGSADCGGGSGAGTREQVAAAAGTGAAENAENGEKESQLNHYPDTHTGVVQLVDFFELEGANGSHVAMVFEVMGPNVLQVIKRFQFKGVPLVLSRKIIRDCLIGLDYLHRICHIIHTDIKPENILVETPLGIPVDKHTGMPLINAEMIVKLLCGPDGKVTSSSTTSAAAPVAPSPTEVAAAPAAVSLQPPEAESQVLYPPYVKNTLKTSWSDPSLLSTYPEEQLKAEALFISSRGNQGNKQQQQGRKQQGGKQGGGEDRGIEKVVQQILEMPEVDDVRERCEKVKEMNLFSHDDARYRVVDLGNACWTHTHFSDDIQTRQYRSPEVIIGSGYDSSSDIWSLACMVFEVMTGDYLFDPKPSDEYPRDEDHLALTWELLGRIPNHMIARGRNGRTFFNKRGELRHIKTLRMWGLSEVLCAKYQIPQMEARNLASFLLPMLKIDPAERITAQEQLKHPWLRGLPSDDLKELFTPTQIQPTGSTTAMGNLVEDDRHNGLIPPPK